MANPPILHHRKSIRLKGYDYSQAGLYFITICVQNRVCLFGDIGANDDSPTNPQSIVRANNDSPQPANNDSPRPTNNDSPQPANNDSPRPTNNDSPQTANNHSPRPTNNDSPQTANNHSPLPNNDSPQHSPHMILNDAGHIANQCWLDIPKHFPNVVLHEFIIMPNHVHGIIELVGAVGANNDSPQPANNHSPQPANNESPQPANNDSPQPANNDSPQPANNHSPQPANNHSPQPANNHSPLRSPSKTIGSIVRGYKIGVTKWFRSTGHMEKIWQRNYWEHIIRDEISYHRISEYIKNNPQNWKKGHSIRAGE
jgi:putative transposase